MNILSPSTVDIMWFPPHTSQQNGLISHYIIILHSVQTTEVFQYNTTEEMFQFSDLHPFYIFQCHITAVTIAPGPSGFIEFQMKEDSKK